ncbi:MAG TPA: hypothetical protein VEK08_25840 [Planctomycetota bacterium]|nr:hypothetical protein [Planctomycetota bacterium]
MKEETVRLTPHGGEVKLPGLSGEQLSFLKIFYKSAEAGELPEITAWLDGKNWPGRSGKIPKLPSTPDALRARERSLLAVGIVVARSHICPLAMECFRWSRENEAGAIIELFIALGARHLNVLWRNDLINTFRDMLVRSPMTRRAVGEALVKSSASWGDIEGRTGKNIKHTKEFFRLFDPAHNLDFAIAVLWADPVARLHKWEKEFSDLHDRFVAEYEPVAQTAGTYVPNYHKLYRAAESVGLLQNRRSYTATH